MAHTAHKDILVNELRESRRCRGAIFDQAGVWSRTCSQEGVPHGRFGGRLIRHAKPIRQCQF